MKDFEVEVQNPNLSASAKKHVYISWTTNNYRLRCTIYGLWSWTLTQFHWATKLPKRLVSHFRGHVYGRCYHPSSRKAPGNYSASIWSNNFSFLLLERPKTQHFMIYALLSPWELLFIDLNIPNHF